MRGPNMVEEIKRRDMLKGGIAMSLGMVAGGSASAAPDENPFPPKKIVMAKPPEYSPLTYLKKVTAETEPKLSFRASTRAEAEAWKQKLRDRLWELIGERHVPGESNTTARLLETKTVENFSREKWEMEVVPGRSMPFYMLKPKSASKPMKTVLCLHGHGNGARDIINEPVDDTARELIKTLNTDYAVQCARRGWCAVAPELFAFGERVDYVEDARPGFDGGCEKPFLNAIEVGKTLIGIRAKDICVLIDWLSTREECSLDSLACIGLSGGGMMTMYTAALDDRIKRALIAGYVTEASGSVLPIRHCSCNYIPGLCQWADFPDVASLIAPRLCIVQTGRKDAIFPIESVRAACKKIEKAYSAYGESAKFLLHEHDGYHAFWSPSLDNLLV
ncbi:alpha/beta hydrolase family protein [bacterium]|nr:alpha/beta hydrolase family protein [bacterium]